MHLQGNVTITYSYQPSMANSDGGKDSLYLTGSLTIVEALRC